MKKGMKKTAMKKMISPWQKRRVSRGFSGVLAPAYATSGRGSAPRAKRSARSRTFKRATFNFMDTRYPGDKKGRGPLPTGTSKSRPERSGGSSFYGSERNGGSSFLNRDSFGRHDRGPVRHRDFPWLPAIAIYVCILLLGAFLPGFLGGRMKSGSNSGTSAAPIAGNDVTDVSAAAGNVAADDGVIVTRTPGPGAQNVQNADGTVYAPQAAGLQGQNVPLAEPVQAGGVPVIDVESVTLAADTSWMRQGEMVQMYADVVPSNATYPALTWSSSNENVARVSQSGAVTSYGGGNVIISATTTNGLTVGYPITVSDSEKRMRLHVSRVVVDNDFVGDDWTFEYSVNGIPVSRNEEMIVALDDIVDVVTTVTENDENPDTATVEGSFIVDDEGFADGFEMEQEIEVVENEGEYAGNTAHYIVTYSFTNVVE
ncbi:MAG TPA: hypothetical protein DCF49_03275 [Lachnospiraceae bacterium]|jgi:hypothetical protein|nr:hypothetical protein [Lachnospiraceae bacterium]